MARSFEYSEALERGKRLDARRPRTSRPPTPVTPIPRRASASSPGAVRVRSRYSNISTDDDVTRLPTVPPSAIWQDEADLYEVERHLMCEYSPFLPSSPSIDELDTLPPTMESQHDERAYADAEVIQQRKAALQFPIEIDEPALQRKVTPQFPIEIDEPALQRKAALQFPIEIDGPGQIYGTPAEHHFQQENVIEERADICEQVTNPPPVPFRPHALLELHNEPSYIDAVVEADTVMDDTLIIVPSLSSDIDMYPTQVEDAVDIALTLRARQLLRHNNSPDTRPAFIHDPLDYMRWWLLYPNRLEFLFWLGGALLLGIVMCIVLVMTGLGLGWMSFGHLVH
ncbi:MAG: DUF3153 domain-containing protein [Ktedonobacteraceae bacterium]|nr:DUF3153 domain-containing protein [Ktedonobacteraceae bacterium]